MRAALLAASLWAACPLASHAQDVPPPAAQAPALEAELDRAFADFAHRAINDLAASASPRERWVAGLMLLGDAARAAGSMDEATALRERAHGLFDAALKDGNDDPVLLVWAALDPPTREEIDNADLAAARLKLIVRLQALEPDNAVPWVAMLPDRAQPGAIPEAMDLLKKAAAAERFDTHFSASMQMLIAAYARVPLPQHWPDTSGEAAWAQTGPEDLPVLMAVGVASSLAMPYLESLSSWCSDADGQPWRESCESLAQTMVGHSDSMVARSLGVSLQTRLAKADSPAHARAMALRRQLAWEVEMGLQHVGPGQPVTFAQWRKAWEMPDASELTVARELLKLQQLPAEPPADYAPAWDR